MKGLVLQNQGFERVQKGFAQWLDVLGYSAQTVYQLPIHLRELLYWLETQTDVQRLEQLTTPLLLVYYQQLQQRANTRHAGALSNTALSKHVFALRLFLRYLRQNGKLILPYLEIEHQSPDTKDIFVVSVNAIQALYAATENHASGSKLEALAARDRAMLSVFYSCGLRRNEGYHLDLSDVDFDKKLLHVRKGKNYSQRLVPFNQINSEIIQEYVFDHRPQLVGKSPLGALFVGERGKRLGPQAMLLRLKKLQQQSDHLELKEGHLTLHALRHSIATHLLEAGMPLEKISRFLGHQSLESTQIYTHLVAESDGHL